MANDAWQALEELGDSVRDVSRMSLILERLVDGTLADRKAMVGPYLQVVEDDAEALVFAVYLLRDMATKLDGKLEAAQKAAR